MSTNTPDPLIPIRKLLDRLQEEANNLGLNLAQAVIVPHATGSGQPDMIQAVFAVKPEAVFDEQDIEQKGIDAEFEAIMGNFSTDVAKDKLEEKKASAIEDLKSFLDGE